MNPGWLKIKYPATTGPGSLASGVNRAFVIGKVPYYRPDDPLIEDALSALGYDLDAPPECIYCGSEPNSWDHLFGLVDDKKPTGYFTSAGNAVPACTPCNTSKGKRHFLTWLLRGRGRSKRIRSEMSRKELKSRIRRIINYLRWVRDDAIPVRVDLNALIAQYPILKAQHDKIEERRLRILNELVASDQELADFRKNLLNILENS